MPKPEKFPYNNQRVVFLKALSFVKKLLTVPCVDEAYLTGSLVEGTFGIYEESWTDHAGDTHTGSDIDVIVVIDDAESLPESWQKTDVERLGCKIYKLGTFKYDGNMHIVDGLIASSQQKSKVLGSLKRKERII